MRGMFAGPVAALIFSLALIVACSPADPVTAAIAGKEAKDVIAEAETSARNVEQDSERAGSAVLAQAANKVEVLAHNIAAQLDADLSKQVGKLSEENQKLLTQLEKMRQSVVDLKPFAFKLKDSTILDLKDLTGDSWFAKKHSYWVQRVDGLTQIQNPAGAEYHLSVTGIGFGTDTDDRRTTPLHVRVDNREIKVREDRPGIYVTDIYFTNTEIKFDDRALRVVPLVIETSVSEKKALAGWTTPARHELRLWLSLMPRFAGTVTVKYSQPVKDWVRISDQPTIYAYQGPNCHRDNTKDPTHPVSTHQTLPDNQRYVAPTSWRPVGGPGCGYNHNQTVTITNNGKELDFGMECDGSGCNFEYSAFVEELRPVSHRESSFNKDITFNDYLVLEFPEGTDFWTITGRTSTLQPISLVKDQTSDILEQKSSMTSGNLLRVVYFVKQPPSY
jgi:hypothetical protein